MVDFAGRTKPLTTEEILVGLKDRLTWHKSFDAAPAVINILESAIRELEEGQKALAGIEFVECEIFECPDCGITYAQEDGMCATCYESDINQEPANGVAIRKSDFNFFMTLYKKPTFDALEENEKNKARLTKLMSFLRGVYRSCILVPGIDSSQSGKNLQKRINAVLGNDLKHGVEKAVDEIPSTQV